MNTIRMLAFMTFAIGVAFAEGPSRGNFVTTDGLKISFLTEGEGTPVILIHGYTGSAEGNWFTNGVAKALVPNHKVIAIDVRGHGMSDKPHDPEKYGDRLWMDVIELMDFLEVKKAHLHGYSMGGMITTQLLARHADRFITASYGGSGVPEVDAEWKAKVPADSQEADPQETEARAKLTSSPNRDEEALAALRGSFQGALQGSIDLTKITIPVMAINGEFDRPNAKTHRLQREVKNFQNVILPGKSHLTAIMAGYIPELYIESLVKFIDGNDK